MIGQRSMKILGILFLVFVLGFVLLAIVAPALNIQNQAVYTRVGVHRYEELRLQAAKGDISQAATSLRGVLDYWPLQVSHEGKFAGIVSAFRAGTVREIITRMRLLSREDLGDEPELWLKKYYREVDTQPSPQGGASASQPSSGETNQTPSAAASRRSR